MHFGLCEGTEQLQVNNQIRTCREQRQAGKTSGDGCFSACLFYHIEVQEEKSMYDVIIIGAGVSGSATARELSGMI